MILNYFHPNITFSYELEQSIKLSLFLIKEGSNIVTTVGNEYRVIIQVKSTRARRNQSFIQTIFNFPTFRLMQQSFSRRRS